MLCGYGLLQQQGLKTDIQKGFLREKEERAKIWSGTDRQTDSGLTQEEGAAGARGSKGAKKPLKN